MIVRRAIERMQRRELATSFYEWRRVTSGSLNWTKKLSAAGRFIGALKHREMFRAFKRWREAARKLRSDGVKVVRCIQRMARNACATSFIEWSDVVREKQRAVRVITKFVGAMRHRAFFRGFNHWRSVAKRLRVDAVKVTRCLHRMMRNSKATVFVDWARHVDDTKRQALAIKMELTEAEVEQADEMQIVQAHFSRWRATRIARVASSIGAQAAFRRVSRTRRRAAVFRKWRRLATTGESFVPVTGDFTVALVTTMPTKVSEGGIKNANSRITHYAASAFYERRSKNFISKVLVRWRAVVVDSRRQVDRLGDEMRLVLQKRRVRRALDAWNEFAFLSSGDRAKKKMAKRFSREKETAKALLGWRGVVANANVQRGTPLPGMKSGFEVDKSLTGSVGRKDVVDKKSLGIFGTKENADPIGNGGWDWNASVLENVSVSSPSEFGLTSSTRSHGLLSSQRPNSGRSGGRNTSSYLSPGTWNPNLLSPVPLPSLDFSFEGGAGNVTPRMGGISDRDVSHSLSSPIETLKGKRLELVSLDQQRKQTSPGTPIRGALDSAYQDVLAECAALEASVEAFEKQPTFAGFEQPATQSRLGVSSLQTNAGGVSADTVSGTTALDTRLVDAGSRAAGLLERAEVMRREMSEVSKEANESLETEPATDWSAGLHPGTKKT